MFLRNKENLREVKIDVLKQKLKCRQKFNSIFVNRGCNIFN